MPPIAPSVTPRPRAPARPATRSAARSSAPRRGPSGGRLRACAALLLLALLGATSGRAWATEGLWLTGASTTGAVLLELNLTGARASAVLTELRSGRRHLLAGTLDDERLLLGNDHAELRGSLRLEEGGSVEGFHGSWRHRGAPEALQLEKLGERVRAELDQGRIHAASELPFFSAPRWRPLNAALLTRYLDDADAFFREGQRELLRSEWFRGWWLEQRAELSYADADLVSVLLVFSTYTGGAHPNLDFAAHTFVMTPTGPREVALSDLFAESERALARLNELLLPELTRQDALWVTSGELTAFEWRELYAFVLSPGGLRFHFAPYAVGPYAQGAFTVTVPYRLLASEAAAGSPLARLAARPAAPRAP